jgi:hypothetical protein
MHVGSDVKRPFLLSGFNQNCSRPCKLKQISVKVPSINFHENPSADLQFLHADGRTEEGNRGIFVTTSCERA